MIEKIQELLAQATGRDATDFADADENLFDSGLIDSMATVQFLFSLQDEYDITVPVSEFDRDEWNTVNKIADRVKELQA
ncbi:D-alanine--poly(phosphoribitol) ligase subunit DltC [Limosilactobacillus fermentum]|uniref:D-alanine--poly(phosphoribitol) ligase subunit DltC n=1 Tax=Limosilactobacillus fermentum TaxID=1613 RepID=UPI000F5DF445|nr:D-alanine--poly(phosphoribitol) ligase subunit DltC [Limosilactobacillus fermentum]AZI17730.1 D-alanine--poly(phosphoribitol) ligase subunit DltC [Limosilactobacillus fermentum]WPP07495.1 D-alanine--poly(phosphoribitol) ligase subunit DltC [Limosilactobacillus fermentum]WRS44377.1 D-alanine--poly(phosphoribitol) ligase subunit DltC [Limosilactobacillus fermentum]